VAASTRSPPVQCPLLVRQLPSSRRCSGGAASSRVRFPTPSLANLPSHSFDCLNPRRSVQPGLRSPDSIYSMATRGVFLAAVLLAAAAAVCARPPCEQLQRRATASQGSHNLLHY